MPEIYAMFFNLSELLKFMPKEDNELNEKIEEYEAKIALDMAENRIRLFSEYGYDSEFEKAYFM